MARTVEWAQIGYRRADAYPVSAHSAPGALAARRIRATIELLAVDPPPPAAKRLAGSGEWRARTGDCRVVDGIEDDRLLVLVLAANMRPLIGITVLGVATVQVTNDRA